MINETAFLKAPYYLPYNYHNKHYRVLWHQGKDVLFKYLEPSKTLGNFDIDVLSKPVIVNATTLSSSITTRYKEVYEDTIIEETWTNERGLSTYTSMFYELLRFLRLPLTSGNYLIWYPKDKNNKRYSILPLSLSIGSEENLLVNPVSDRAFLDQQWLTEPLSWKFRIIRPYTPPDTVVFFTGV